jgi:hypothetical protein
MVLDESRSLLFMATADDDQPGEIISLMTAPHIAHSFEKIAVHSGAITAMQLSPSCSHIVSGDEHGMLFVSEIEGQGSFKTLAMRMLEGAAQFEFQEEVLIHKVDLESKKKKISELTGKVDELNMNNDHQLRLKEMDHKAKVKEISAKFNKELETESGKYVEMLSEKSSVETQYKESMNDMNLTQETSLAKVKAKYEDKLNQEEDRHRQLNQDTARAHELWNVENVALVDAHQEYLRSLTAEYEERLRLESEEQKEIALEKEHMQV